MEVFPQIRKMLLKK